jgi:hypothetical protein
MEDKTLKDLDLCVLEVQDANIIMGGNLIDFSTSMLKKITPAAFTIWVVENWDEVKKGFSDGWNVR